MQMQGTNKTPAKQSIQDDIKNVHHVNAIISFAKEIYRTSKNAMEFGFHKAV